MVVLLDTNVVSELIRKVPDPAVEAWVSSHHSEDLFFSAVGEAELRYGAAILPTGRRREVLVSDIKRMLRDVFESCVLPFDGDAARAYGISPPCAVPPDAPSHRRTARSRPSPAPATWR